MKRKTKNIIGALVITAALGAVIVSGITGSYRYYYSVDEVISGAGGLVGKEIKIAGEVLKGSAVMKEMGKGALFKLSGSQGQVKVDYDGRVPDTFREGAPVVVEGRLIGVENIKAFSLITKCASKYEEKL